VNRIKIATIAINNLFLAGIERVLHRQIHKTRTQEIGNNKKDNSLERMKNMPAIF
jgi:hypothetical protein